MTASPTLSRAWKFGVYYTLFVILFGAVVRISGSGAGCGQHWPTCHGEIAHLPKSVETLIEMTHRLTSGASMLVVFGLTFWTVRAMPQGHVARKAALWSSALMISEALLGAGLVLLALVGKNDSVSRALVMALHLVNTSALLFAMVSAAWASGRPASFHLHLWGTSQGEQRAGGDVLSFWQGHAYWLGALLIVLVSAAGAITALGDTVYPVGERASLTVAAEMVQPGAHFLEQLRGVHPILASFAATFFIALGSRSASVWGRVVVLLTLTQVGAGLLNIYLSAPGWMQVLHLAIANALWIAWTIAWLDRKPSRERGPVLPASETSLLTANEETSK